MSDDQAQRAIEQLYEDTSARDELSDDEANVLLQWGEAQIHELGARNLDDNAFDEAISHLNGVLKNINRYTGQRAYKTPEELTALLNELATQAQAMGVDVQVAQLAIPEAQAVDSDNIAVINALTSLVTPGQTPAMAAPTTPAAQPPQPPPPSADDSPAESLLDKFKKLF
ncbi:MAG: hypothetical protein ABI690_28020 [Chloroflexota bacterium]